MIRSNNEPDHPTHETTLFPMSNNEPVSMPDAPVIVALAPDEATLGQPSFTMFISGTGFYAASVIVFAGQDEPTTLNEDGSLSTGINMPLWAGPDTVKVAVRNGPVMSEEVDFTFAAEGTPEAEVIDPTDPDELEDELDQAREEGDFKPTHARRKKKR